MEIIYAGPKDNKEVKGMFFPRLAPIEVPADIARDLCAVKPRVFFYAGEQLPESVINDRLALSQAEAQQFKKHIRDYTIQAAQYTDEKDAVKREGAEAEIAWAEEQLEECKNRHRTILASIHADEEVVEQLNQYRPARKAGVMDVKVAEVTREKEAAEKKVEELSEQVANLTSMMQAFLAAQPAPKAQEGPSDPAPESSDVPPPPPAPEAPKAPEAKKK